jgi:hypothetical protein
MEEIACIDGVHYSHYFTAPMTGRALGGTALHKLNRLKFSFTMGHQQGKDTAEQYLANGRVIRGVDGEERAAVPGRERGVRGHPAADAGGHGRARQHPREELDQQIERAVTGFSSIEGLDDSVAERLVGEGFLSYDDLSVIEPDDLMEMGGLSAEQVDAIVAEAERRAQLAEVAAADERRKQREQERIDKATAEADAVEAAAKQAAGEATGDVDAVASGGGSVSDGGA